MICKNLTRISALLLAILLCFSLFACKPITNNGNIFDDIFGDANTNETSVTLELDLIHVLFDQISVYDVSKLDHNELMKSALKLYAEVTGDTAAADYTSAEQWDTLDRDMLKATLTAAYAEATGDLYAAYYNKEELDDLNSDNQGEMEGIGISVVNDSLTLNGEACAVLTIISVFMTSPALDAGLYVGDSIYSIVDSKGETHTVQELGHDTAIMEIRGAAGTYAEFTVLRRNQNGEYTEISFKVPRKKITSESVTGRIYEKDPTIGILKIAQFDLTTPTQFTQTMDSLISQGCDKFVFDMRNNPGGDLKSIEAVLSTFLNEGDTMISTVYKDGTGESDKVQVVTSLTGAYAGCNIAKEDIGKYKGYQFSVITNKYTASAAELFTANLRDYDLATLIGMTTYGKGCMQSMFDLSYFGSSGALKLTAAWYLPPCGVNYHDIGIAPDIEVELSEEIIQQYGNIHLIPDTVDPQLQAAIQALT